MSQYAQLKFFKVNFKRTSSLRCAAVFALPVHFYKTLGRINAISPANVAKKLRSEAIATWAKAGTLRSSQH